jgi:hypothetical protein
MCSFQELNLGLLAPCLTLIRQVPVISILLLASPVPRILLCYLTINNVVTVTQQPQQSGISAKKALSFLEEWKFCFVLPQSKLP